MTLHTPTPALSGTPPSNFHLARTSARRPISIGNRTREVVDDDVVSPLANLLNAFNARRESIEDEEESQQARASELEDIDGDGQDSGVRTIQTERISGTSETEKRPS